MKVSISPDKTEQKTRAVSELPVDELIMYGRELGLPLADKMGHGEMLRLVRARQELLLQLDREVMLEIVVWARHPIRKSASKEQLAKEIATIRKMDFTGLGDGALTVLAQLRNVSVTSSEKREMVEARLRDAEPFWNRVKRRRRKFMGSMISKLVQGNDIDEAQDYRFLPEDNLAGSLKNQIEEEGVMGGIARKIRGVADDYVREKLDEIEARIDTKLDEIDARLAEWRDREIANRLKIIKVTLVASVLVAILSYVYSLLME